MHGYLDEQKLLCYVLGMAWPATEVTSKHSVLKTEHHLACLSDAAAWANVEAGRVWLYHRAIGEASASARNAEHVLSHSESFEPVDLYELWRDRAAEFPGLIEKIAGVMKDGPNLQELEKASNSGNRPRNDAFVFWLAEILEAGVEVVASGRRWDSS
jgi:hypothetical protein